MNKDLPDGWKWIKLGDIAFEVSDRIDNPSESGLERFVGLEHMDSESLTIKRWGSTDDVTSAMKFFKKGDMLFARRNAYLKRASMATFDGVCSGDAIVLRQKNAEYVNGLLPLILNSEKLWEFAIANASGSMSKRVKWRDLATFEIPLPPKEEQRSIADILWAAEDFIVKNEKLVEDIEFYKKILMVEIIKKGIGHSEFQDTEIGTIPDGWKVVKLGEISKISYGLGQPPPTKNDGVLMIRATNIKSGKILIDGMLKIDTTKIPPTRGIFLKCGDIIVVRSGAYTGDIGFVTKEFEGSVAGYDLIVSADRDKVDPQFLSNYLLTPKIQKIYFEALKIRSAQPHLNSNQLMNTLVALPSLSEQRHIVEVLSKIDDTIQKSQESVIKIKALKMILINQFLNDGISPALLDNPQGRRVIYETQVSE